MSISNWKTFLIASWCLMLGFFSLSSLADDFSGDGASDVLLRNNSSGHWYMATMYGGVPETQNLVRLTNNLDWQEIARADFNGDGQADILMRHPDGRWFMAFMQGYQVLSQGYVALTRNQDWEFLAAEDFDGDNRADILLRHADGHWFAAFMDGRNVISQNYTALTLNNDWNFIAAKDFSGDAKADILLRHSTGKWFIATMNGRAPSTQGLVRLTADLDWSFQDAADYSGDGKADILLRHPDGRWFMAQMDGQAVNTQNFAGLTRDTDWALQSSADYNGDGRADILLRHSAGRWFMAQMNGRTAQRQEYVRLSQKPVWTTSGLSERVTTIEDPCTDGLADVFIDCVDPTWKGFSAWDNKSQQVYVDSSMGEHINWSIVDVGGENNKVIDVSFSDSEIGGFFQLVNSEHKYNSVPTPSQTLDMSSFSGGKIKFDIRVLDFGMSLQYLRFSLASLDGTSLGLTFPLQNIETWQSVDISVNDLVALGVDLSQLITAIQINPEWGFQEGVHFQLDNIRWEQFSCNDATIDISCVDPSGASLGGWDTDVNDLYGSGSSNHVQWQVVSSADEGRNEVIDLTFGSSGAWGTFYVITNANFDGVDMSSFNSGAIIFDMKVIDGGDPAAKFNFSINCGDESGGSGEGSEACRGLDIELDKSIVGVWQEVYIPMSDIIDSGVDLSDVGTGFHFGTTFGVSQENIHVQFDNIRWVQ